MPARILSLSFGGSLQIPAARVTLSSLGPSEAIREPIRRSLAWEGRGRFGHAAVFAFVRVTVFDGQTFAIREDPFGSLGARLSSSLSRLVKDEFLRDVDGAEFPESSEAAAKDARLHDAARNLVAERLERILPEYLKK
jgi:hypothetical protein